MTTAEKSRTKVLPLQPGDNLTRAEFERRYEATSGLKKAELIEGVVYMPPPASHDHSSPAQDVNGWFWIYRSATPHVSGGDNGTVRLDQQNEPQPDAFLMIDAKSGGEARIDEDGYVEGAPELVAEIAVSSASYDLHAKLHAYCRNGVREYIVWRVYDREIDWFVLREGNYDRLAPGADGTHRSIVFPGLWLDTKSMIAGDLPAVLRALQQGLATAEHAEFVRQLEQRRAGKS
jgi:Uma2 family endonuclease